MSYSTWFAKLAMVAAVAAFSAATAPQAEAQFGKKLKESLKKRGEDKIINKAGEEQDKGIDTVTERIKSTVTGKGQQARDTATTGGQAARPAADSILPGEGATAAPASAPPSGSDPGASTSSASGPAATQSKKIWANYDFVPGQRTLFFTDFTDDEVGNFPARLEFKTGQMEVVEFEGGQRALKASSASDLIIPLPEVLPEKFTVELDVISRKTQGVAANTFEIIGGREARDDKVTQIGWGYNGYNVYGAGLDMDVPAKDADKTRYVGNPASFRILADGKALKLYVDEKRIANIPTGNFKRDKAIFLRLEARDDEDNAVYVTRIRVAESQKSIYDALSKAGRWTTQGIMFDTGKWDIKPESTPTLKQIAATLKEHPELKVEVQGHTDNVGAAAANLTLSQARADAVKAALTKDYGVAAAQITAKGYGDTKPAADNKTVEGRANNRRVELVKS